VPFKHIQFENYHDINEAYQTLDLYIVASRQEADQAVLECMATGIRLSVRRVGQAMDLVKHGENGWLTEVEDIEGLVHWSSAALQQTDLDKKKMIQSARRTAEKIPMLHKSPVEKIYGWLCGNRIMTTIQIYLPDKQALAFYREKATAEFWDKHWKTDTLKRDFARCQGRRTFCPHRQALPARKQHRTGGWLRAGIYCSSLHSIKVTKPSELILPLRPSRTSKKHCPNWMCVLAMYVRLIYPMALGWLRVRWCD